MESEYTIHFNSYKPRAVKQEKEEDEGPIIERKCPKCSNDKMSYATLQLRSADEGQTVFYTCTKCKYGNLGKFERKMLKFMEIFFQIQRVRKFVNMARLFRKSAKKCQTHRRPFFIIVLCVFSWWLHRGSL